MLFTKQHGMRLSVWHDQRGVSSTNVAVLVAFAALVMPGFVALGDGLAENVVGRSNANPYGGSGYTGGGGGGYYDNAGGAWGEANNVNTDGPSDYWGGGDDIMFESARPGTTPWENHEVGRPESFTGTTSDFGVWGEGGEGSAANGGGSDVNATGSDASGEGSEANADPSAANNVNGSSAGEGNSAAPGTATGPTQVVTTEGGSGSNANADLRGATPFSADATEGEYASAPGYGEGGATGSSSSSLGGQSQASGSPQTPFFAAFTALGEGWLSDYYSTSVTAVSIQPGAGVGGNTLTPEQAIAAVLENPAAFSASEYLTIRSMEQNGLTISLASLQKVANGDDPELAAVANYILGDRALREALTEGSSTLSTQDLENVASELENTMQEGNPWLANGSNALDASAIDQVIKSTADGNPPDWARNTTHVLGADFDLLADSSGENGTPRISADTLNTIAGMNQEEWEAFQAERGIQSQFTLEQVQGAARAATNSGLFDYLDAPPGMGVDANGLVGRELLLSFSDESMRQGESWAEYLRDDNAADASTADLKNEDGANALDGEPLVMREVEGDLFSGTERSELMNINPRLAVAEGLQTQASVSASDVVQGATGDCYAMSTLASFAENRPEVIRNMISENGDGTYTVRLYNPDGELVETTVDNEFAASAYDENGTLFAQTDSALWAGLVEKAMTEVWDGRNGANDDMMSIDGGQEAMMHQMLTGKEADTVYLFEPTEGNASAEFLAEMPQNATVASSGDAVASQLETWSGEGRAITVTTTGDSKNATINSAGLTSGHSYSVMNVENGQVTLRDPRGDEFNLTISMDEFNDAFVSMTST